MSAPDPETAPEAPADPKPRPAWVRRSAAALRWMRSNAYLALVAGGILVITNAVDFSPPPEVRVGKTDVASMVGDAPQQDFSHELSNAQAVQVRATLRLYPDEQLVVSEPDPDTDSQGKLLSQPVVTTILGMTASVEQTVRLDGGNVEVDLTLHATPRLANTRKKKAAAPPLALEHEITITSRRSEWWRPQPVQRVHLDARGILSKVEDHGYRIVFTVDEHLFSLDLELHRPYGV